MSAKPTRLVTPALAYDERGAGKGFPPNATRLFEAELIKIE